MRPVGSAKRRTVNVRVVAATNRDLEQEIRAGRFREGSTIAWRRAPASAAAACAAR